MVIVECRKATIFFRLLHASFMVIPAHFCFLLCVPWWCCGCHGLDCAMDGMVGLKRAT